MCSGREGPGRKKAAAILANAVLTWVAQSGASGLGWGCSEHPSTPVAAESGSVLG